MEIFLDTADAQCIKEWVLTGLIDGITTNPSLMAKSGHPIKVILKELATLVPGSVSAEVTATDYEGMMAEAAVLRQIASNITIKVPLTLAGLKACRALIQAGATVNVTLCFSANQALLAAKAGATYVSPFLGRLDDIGGVGLDLIRDIRLIYDQYPSFSTKILAASLRHPWHVLEVAKLGVDVVTLPPALFQQLYAHPLTDLGLETFLKDWKATGQKIL